jgi:hypothetical protein
MKEILLTICLLTFIFNSIGQNLAGVVFEQGTGSPVSYVSIGIINKSGGTYSDVDGKFQFMQNDFDKADSLRFSCIGYKPVTIPMSELLGKSDENEFEVFMEKEIFHLKGVEIYPKEYTSKEIGNKISNQHICICGSNDVEGGIIIRNKKKLFLDKLTFRLSSECTQMPDSVLLRVNFYNTSNDLPSDILLTEPIYLVLTKEIKTDQVIVDIEKYRIAVDGDFAATIEIIKIYGTGKICFAGWISGYPTVLKYGKQGRWAFPADDKRNRLKIYQSIVVSARSEK